MKFAFFLDVLCAKSWNPSIYNILRWEAWTMGKKNRWPRVWCSKYYFFILFYRLRALKTLYFYFCNVIKKWKVNWKDFCKEFSKKSWKWNNKWNIRCLVDDSFVLSSKQPRVLYCRLTDFEWELLRKKLKLWYKVSLNKN